MSGLFSLDCATWGAHAPPLWFFDPSAAAAPPPFPPHLTPQHATEYSPTPHTHRSALTALLTLPPRALRYRIAHASLTNAVAAALPAVMSATASMTAAMSAGGGEGEMAMVRGGERTKRWGQGGRRDEKIGRRVMD